MIDLLMFSFRRLLALILILYIVATTVFLLAHASPYDPISGLISQQADQAGTQHGANHREEAHLRHAFGLDRPLWQQYVLYLSDLAQGRFGLSEAPDTFQQPVANIVMHSLPVTVKLAGFSLAFALLVGLPIGLLSALKHNSPVDHAGQTVMMLLYALPTFVIAPIIRFLFGVQLHWLPVMGWGAPGLLGIQQMVMPVGIYGLGMAAYFSKICRAFLLEVLRQDYIRTARAKGLQQSVIIARHACKNTVVPLASILGPAIAHMILGAFVIEYYFSIPGMGLATVTSITGGNFPVIEATTIVLATTVVTVNALTDILCATVDPRLRTWRAP